MWKIINYVDISYEGEINRYKKYGKNYTLYYRIGLIKLKYLTDNDIDRLILENKQTKIGQDKATYEILTHYKSIRRKEKITKLKNKIKRKHNIFKFKI